MQFYSQQRSCGIFVDKYVTNFIKQRSCDILICQNFIRSLMITYNYFKALKFGMLIDR